MTTEELKEIRHWFQDYADGFRETGGGLAPELELKKEHTRQVAENARELAGDLQWATGDIRLAEALGWLHDVGRFSQFAEFGHFHDAASLNHGFRGAEIVEAAGLLNPLASRDAQCLAEGIRHHNAKTIPEDLAPEIRPFLELIRDADKLDIYRIVTEGLKRNGFRELGEMLPHVDMNGGVTPRLLQDVRNRQSADAADVHSLADFLLLQANWIHTLNFAPARERVRKGRFLDILRQHLPDDSESQSLMNELIRDLAFRANH